MQRSNQTTEAILKKLWRAKDSFEKLPREKCCGVYALYLRSGFQIPYLMHTSNSPIYIGRRNAQSKRPAVHFKDGRTRTSSPRRTFGALLRSKLKLRLDCKPSRAKKDKFRFVDESEKRLSKWMCGKLYVSFYRISKNALNELEAKLIECSRPSLNLNLRGNLKSREEVTLKMIKKLRQKCAEDAARGRQ